MEHGAERPVLAVDLGGTQIRVALITPDRSVHCRRAEPTRDEDGPDGVVERIAQLVTEVRADAAAERLPEPAGIGIMLFLSAWFPVATHQVPLSTVMKRSFGWKWGLLKLPGLNLLTTM